MVETGREEKHKEDIDVFCGRFSLISRWVQGLLAGILDVLQRGKAFGVSE